VATVVVVIVFSSIWATKNPHPVPVRVLVSVLVLVQYINYPTGAAAQQQVQTQARWA
jgi:hypothetical protein